MRRRSLVFVLVALLAAQLMTAPRVLATSTLVVDADGAGAPGNCAAPDSAYTSLGAAVAAALDGDTIEVCAGTYTLTANITLDKSLTIRGPNAAISPQDPRVSEAVIDGGDPGPLNGAGGYRFDLAVGITELIVEGLTLTNFDGNTFASSLVPVEDVVLRRNIFTANNGGLFFKFDTSVATRFDVVDNMISTHSMAGVSSALFFLGNIADSHFDDNHVSSVAARELVNVYDTLASSTFNRNTLTSTGGLVWTFADVTDLEIDDNAISSTATGGGGAPIYVGTNNGHAVSDVRITNNEILTVTGGIGIKLAVDTAGAGSIEDVLVGDNTIDDTATYGLAIDTFGGSGTGTIDGITVTNNVFGGNRFGPILAYARPTSGTNIVRNLTIYDNDFAIDAADYGGSFFLNDFRNVSGTNTFSGNALTISGALPGGTDALRGMAIRGSQTGTWNIVGNDLNGGGLIHNGVPTVFVSGIAILSEDGTTGSLPSTAVINIQQNVITGFEDAVVVRDGVAPTGYGSLAVGLDMNVNRNDLSGNSLFALRSGAAGETIDGTCNWWGASDGPGGAGPGTGADVSVNVDVSPWLVTPGLDGDCNSGTARGTKQGAVYILSLISTGIVKTDKAIGDAIAKVADSLLDVTDKRVWDGDDRVDGKHADKVFKLERDAVRKLMNIKDAPVGIQQAIDDLVAADRRLAEVAINDATGGDPKKLADAAKELDKALADISKGHFDAAIDHYRNAWKAAHGA